MPPFASTRDIPATPEAVFAAISNSERLERWWGPSGFTNTFEVCEFFAGGRWRNIMHGPNGHDFPNESTFTEIEAPRRVVIDHRNPNYVLTIELAASETGTLVRWTQVFENENFAQRMASIIGPATEQNLDRLTAEVLGM